MNKLVCESVDPFINEAKGDGGDDSHGVIGGLWKAAKTAPARFFRRGRARKIMQKYKDKLSRKIDIVIKKYLKNIEDILTKTKNRLDMIDSSGGTDDVKATQKEEVMKDVEEAFENVVKTMKGAADDQVKVYAESLQDRLQRKGTITGVEFLPEDKTELLSEWKTVEEEINYEVQTKLLTLLDNITISELDEVKANVKDFIEQQKPFKYPFHGGGDDSEPSTVTDATELAILRHITSTGFSLDTPITITRPALFPDNTREPYFEFRIDNSNGTVGYAFYTKVTRGGVSKIVKSTANPTFYRLQRPTDTNPREWQNRLNTIIRLIP